MTASDWFVLVFVAPLMITAGWVVCLKVWCDGRDVSQAVGWFAGERGSAGYHAFMGPGFLAMTAGWVGTVLTEIDQAMKVSPAWLGPTIGICFAVTLGCLFLGFLAVDPAMAEVPGAAPVPRLVIEPRRRVGAQ